jgi:hypothetical protein
MSCKRTQEKINVIAKNVNFWTLESKTDRLFQNVGADISVYPA